MRFEQKCEFFKTHKISYMGPLWITVHNMLVMTKKYGVSVSLCRKLAIFGKSVG
jgi:hypothetical protein